MKKRIFSVVLALALAVGILGAATADPIQVNTAPDLSVTLEGKDVELKDANGNDVVPLYVEGTTYLPIRALAEAMGYEVSWDGDAQQVQLSTPSGLVPGLVELTVFGNHVKKPDSQYPQGQIFNAGYTAENAPTYTNPIVFDYNYSAARGTLGQISNDPFFVGRMIAGIQSSGDPSNLETYTHSQNADLFRGTGTYIQENGSRAAADPHGMYYNSTWYIYATGGYQLVSTDFVNWEVVPAINAETGAQFSFTAPTVDYTVDANGTPTFYLAWNGSHIWRSVGSPTGPWTDLGDFTYRGLSFSKNLKYNEEDGTFGDDHAATPYESNDSVIMAAHSDVNIFVDREDNNRMYLCWGMGSKYMNIAELNPENPTELMNAPVEVIPFNPESSWEGFGQYHQDYETGFAEGSMLFKYNGVYYWTFATGGTQYDSYTFGVYTNSTNDLLNKDNWVYQEKEVINPDGDDALWGSVRGGGHGSIAEGPNGQLWCFYTVNIGYEGDMERRLGADPAYIDADGNLIVPHLSENPQYVPGVLANPCGEAGNETGADILSGRQFYGVSSYSEGRHPMYANDDSPLTWWQPAADDANPYYIVGLKGLYNVESVRVMIKDIDVNKNAPYQTSEATYSYTIEIYNGNENPVTVGTSANDATAGWVTVATVTDGNILNYIELDGALAQFVRITFTDWTGKIS